MMRDDFAALILSHGRADDVQTIKALRLCGYTGKWFVIADDEDTDLPKYQARYTDRLIVFSKSDIDVDTADNSGSREIVVYARNAVDKIAADLGLTHYWMLDDDYKSFGHRWKSGDQLKLTVTKHLDLILDSMIEFLDTSGAITVCFAQAGDYLGGWRRKFYREAISRKAMNTFLCRVGHPISFSGRTNEDTTAYVTWGGRGELFLTITDVAVLQTETQIASGGLTNAYLQDGTYRKSFYTVLHRPDAVQVIMMPTRHSRPHHRITWDRAVPKIMSDRWRKSPL